MRMKSLEASPAGDFLHLPARETADTGALPGNLMKITLLRVNASRIARGRLPLHFNPIACCVTVLCRRNSRRR